MNVIILIKNNFLLITLFVTQTLMLLFALGETTHIEKININNAIFYHVVMTFSFCIGYLLVKKGNFNMVKPNIAMISNTFFYFTIIITTLGLLTSIATTASVYPIGDYFNLLMNYQDNHDVLRDIKAKTMNSGISGIFKVFNYTPLGVFFATSSFLSFYHIPYRKDRFRLITILIYAILCSILKIFFSLDRLTILGLCIVMSYTFLFSKRKVKIYFAIGLVIIFLLLSFVTSAKMANMNVLDFIKLYCQLGLTNFELLIEHQKQYSFGFNTFLMPLYFVGVFFNYVIEIPQAEVIIWDNAQYFYGYLYLDFGVFAILANFLIGFIIGKYQKLINNNNISAISIYFVIVFCICTFIIVPIVRAIEFWWLIIVCYFLSLLINRKKVFQNQ